MPPDMWNSYSDSEDRTTNRVEEFHSKLNKVYPNIHVLINVFKKLEAKYEILNYNLRNREQFTLANRFTSGQITLANRFTSGQITLANRFTSEQFAHANKK
jgi:short-subunit dehydrogenase involved in D-alanine esterification of teichoic acids